MLYMFGPGCYNYSIVPPVIYIRYNIRRVFGRLYDAHLGLGRVTSFDHWNR